MKKKICPDCNTEIVFPPCYYCGCKMAVYAYENLDDIKEEFWNRVIDCKPEEIKSKSEVKIVSNEDIDWLVKQIIRFYNLKK